MHNMRWSVAWVEKHFVRTLSPEHKEKIAKTGKRIKQYQVTEKKNRNSRTMKRAVEAKSIGRQRFRNERNL